MPFQTSISPSAQPPSSRRPEASVSKPELLDVVEVVPVVVVSSEKSTVSEAAVPVITRPLPAVRLSVSVGLSATGFVPEGVEIVERR